MDRCEEDVIIACGLYFLVEEEKRKKRKYWIHKVFRAREEEGEFQALMSLHQNNKLFLVHDKRCLVSHWPPASESGMLLITTFLELRLVAGRS